MLIATTNEIPGHEIEEVFAECGAGLYDGLRVDSRGHLWLSAGDGVHCHDDDGTLLGKIRIPEVVACRC